MACRRIYNDLVYVVAWTLRSVDTDFVQTFRGELIAPISFALFKENNVFNYYKRYLYAVSPRGAGRAAVKSILHRCYGVDDEEGVEDDAGGSAYFSLRVTYTIYVSGCASGKSVLNLLSVLISVSKVVSSESGAIEYSL